MEHLLAYQPDHEHRAVLKAIQTTLQARIARTVPHIQASDGLGPNGIHQRVSSMTPRAVVDRF